MPDSQLPHEFLLPDLGEGLAEAEIVSWRVSPGDVVAIDQIVVEVESAKSVVELPSPFGGRIVTLHAAAGETVRMGAPLITVVPLGAEPAADASGPPDAAAPAVERRLDSGMAAGSGAVLVGYGTSESSMRLQRPAGGRFGARVAPPPASATTTTTLLDPARRSPVVSPLVRKRAKTHGFDASQLAGSGPNSLVLRDDVEAAIAEIATRGSTTSSVQGSAEADVVTSAVVHRDTGDLRIPITGLRKVAAERLSRSRREIPEATIWLDVDATELVMASERLQKSTGEQIGRASCRERVFESV